MTVFSLQDAKEATYSKIEPVLDDSGGYLEDDSLSQQFSRRHRRRCWIGKGLCVGGVFICSLTAFFAGRYTANPIFGVDTDVPLESVIFQPNPKFSFFSQFSNSTPSSPSDAYSDAAWTSLLLPAGEGFVFVEKPERFQLPAGREAHQRDESQSGAFYDVSVFHQLHCLVKIREHVRLVEFALHEIARDREAGNDELTKEYLRRLLEPLRQERHMGHCFDYLRQGIMCAGDMSLEGVVVGEEKENGVMRRGGGRVVDGWGMKHECKSWDAIMQYVRENEHA
ncbi:hypothetical protein CERZMDRAFT_95894 [Cercospora zeae-maydis SCOH1-5]|uniref:Uncharacterized protein n=1 Tax=Cercospora zeae-maydis SCOH1-5 TaxID=717836 RepID=A0A6A6FKP9_9PEZI|nr:hypothetical protein CERZMDRAFT_95894 [Cercospora zeae-maydis SCOH1-5]